MKKTILLSLAPFLFGAVAVQAQASSDANSTKIAISVSSDKTPVKKEDLPESVKKTLATDAYKGWEIVDAALVKNETTSYYEINAKKEDKLTLIKLDAEGKKVD